MIFCFVLKIVKEDLSVLRVNLLAENQECSSVIIILAFSISSSIELQWKNTFVSSAKILTLPVGQQLGRSLINKRKNRGPRTEPCGTPQDTVLVFDLLCSMLTYCLRSLR